MKAHQTLSVFAASALLAGAPLFGDPIGPTGPDAFGHTGDDVAFALRDIQATGTPIALTDDDSEPVSIGFDFSFYGNTFDSVFVASNGFLSFTDSGTYCCDGLPLPGNGAANLIAGAWNDFDPTEGGQVYVETTGSPGSREFVVGFYDVQHNLDFNTPPSPSTFEMILHETSNHIEFQYAELLHHGDAGIGQFGQQISIGIQDETKTDGIQVAFYPGFPPDDTVVLSEQGYLIVPPAPPCPWDCGDGNGSVATADLLALLAEWGTPGACDFDGSGATGTADLLKLLANWGPC
jgi:hypothetical protein